MCAERVTPLSVRYLPPAQEVQTEVPVLGAKYPAKQMLQLDAPLPPEKRPAAHAVHDEADAAEYKPAAHDSQTLDAEAPATFEYDPAPHRKQDVEPVKGWYRPVKQLKHALAPEAE